MPSPNLHLTFRDGGTADAGDPYTGLDRFGRLVETLWKTGSTDQVRSKYGRNRFGGVVWRRDEEAHAQTPSVATEDNYYGYDGLQQVKQRQRGDLTGPAPDYTGVTNLQQEEDWTHDATGNWAATSNTSPTNAQTRTHNPANEITQISAAPGDVEPAYDPVGNMLTLPKEPGTSTEQYDLVWDAWNRLVAVKDGGAVVASYTYDGLTRRQTKTNAAETRHYYYNVAWRALEERVEGASVPVDRQYTWGLHDRWDLVRRKRSVGGSLDETLFLLRDYLDPVAIVDETGTVVERYAYDAFGNVRFLAPDYTSKSGSDFDWEFLFHAEFLDRDTKLYNYGYRYYDTNLARWLSRDPIGEEGGENLYAFCINSSIGHIDYTGLDPIAPAILGTPPVTLTIRTLGKPKLGYCGEHLWNVAFLLSRNAVASGWIIQKINYKRYHVYNCKGRRKWRSGLRNFSESFPVHAGANKSVWKDQWGSPEQGDCTRGELIVEGWATFHEGLPIRTDGRPAGLPSDWKTRPKFPHNDFGPTSIAWPIFQGRVGGRKSNTAYRMMTITWDCCQNRSKTKIKIDNE